MPEGVKDEPNAYVATALDSEPGVPAVATPRAIGTPREDRAGDREAKALDAGTFVGSRYRIVRFIARGGMGEVYEAFDEELRVAVALKVASKTTGKALDRFRREVMLARRVTHRNVCRLFEIGFETIGDASVPY
jgi:DNA-directed RNA polymerase subunit K/omega